MDYNGDNFDVYRRITSSTHGDRLIIDKSELNATLNMALFTYYQMENIHAYYGVPIQVDIILLFIKILLLLMIVKIFIKIENHSIFTTITETSKLIISSS